MLSLLISMAFSFHTVNIAGVGQFKEYGSVTYELGSTTLIFTDFDCYNAIPNAKGGGLLRLYTPGTGNAFFLQYVNYNPQTKTFFIVPSSGQSMWCEQVTTFRDGFE